LYSVYRCSVTSNLFSIFRMQVYYTFYYIDFYLFVLKSGSLNWPWSTKILGQLVTRMHKNWFWYWKLSVLVMSPIKTIYTYGLHELFLKYITGLSSYIYYISYTFFYINFIAVKIDRVYNVTFPIYDIYSFRLRLREYRS
jgi:hypothetical protein